MTTALAKCGYTGGNYLANCPPGSIEVAIQKNREGRASKITPELCCRIVELLESGSTMTEISRMEGMPALSNIYAACQLLPEFKEAIDRARYNQADALFDTAGSLVDNVTVAEDMDQKFVSNTIRKAEIQSRTRIRMAESYNPAKYGAKQTNINLNANSDVGPVDLSAFLLKD